MVAVAPLTATALDDAVAAESFPFTCSSTVSSRSRVRVGIAAVAASGTVRAVPVTLACLTDSEPPFVVASDHDPGTSASEYVPATDPATAVTVGNPVEVASTFTRLKATFLSLDLTATVVGFGDSAIVVVYV